MLGIFGGSVAIPAARTQDVVYLRRGSLRPRQPADPIRPANQEAGLAALMALGITSTLRPHPARPQRWLRPALPYLSAILAIQVLLALRLIWSNTAFIDEATYLYSGGQELAHWLHGDPVANFQEYFSGAPVIYPPGGAIMAAVGGLAAARLLSLAFMLGTTVLLYSAAARLFGKRAGLLGAAFFAALGITQFLSALATYDAMALFLLALAAFLIVRYGPDCTTMPAAIYSTAVAPAVLALANATKYATALWDPVIIALAVCMPLLGGRGWRPGLIRASRLTAVLVTCLALFLLVGKQKYITGILYTTVNRSSSQPGMGTPVSQVLASAWNWAGVAIVATVAGAVLLALFREHRALRLTGLVLLAAMIAAPANQARIGTAVSLQKHLVIGAWFGCMLGGYALARLSRYRAPAAICGAVLVAVVPLYFAVQASALYKSWEPVNPAFVAGLRGVVHPGQQKYLITNSMYLPAYYVGPSVTSLQWKETIGYEFTDPKTGATYGGTAALERSIRARIFAAVIVVPDGTSNEGAVQSDLYRLGGYYLAGYLAAPTPDQSWRCQVWVRDGLTVRSA